jgi:hypothetical protein
LAPEAKRARERKKKRVLRITKNPEGLVEIVKLIGVGFSGTTGGTPVLFELKLRLF